MKMPFSLFLISFLLISPLFARDPVQPVGYVDRDRATGTNSVKANLVLLKRPTAFTVTELWQLSSDRKKWFKLPFTPTTPRKIVPEARRIYSRESDPVVARLTDKIGLYWVKWKENGRQFESFVYSGPMLCQDVDIGPMSKGDMVATCIPSADSATAAYVPNPKIYCK